MGAHAFSLPFAANTRPIPQQQKFMSYVTPTGVERAFSTDDIIVSKTDLKGHITYANRVFLEIASLTERQVIGAPHSIIRHPDMPRCVFKLLWDSISAGREVFAYVVNMASNGDHYWVLAHVTPTFGPEGKIIGYHSNRRVPEPAAVALIKDIYARLLIEEAKHKNAKRGMAASGAMLTAMLQAKGVSYDEFIFSV